MPTDTLQHICRMKVMLAQIQGGSRNPALAVFRAVAMAPADNLQAPQILVAEIGPAAAGRILWGLNTLVDNPPAIASIEFAHDERVVWLQCSHDGGWTALHPSATCLRVERDQVSVVATGTSPGTLGWRSEDCLARVLATDEIGPGVHVGEEARRWLATDGYTADEIADIPRDHLAPAEASHIED